MKFHCDRCKTRYSIADERVRGKILKVRCKNCSAVISVREPGAARPASVAPPVPAAAKAAAKAPKPAGGSALRGAFQQAMERPEPSAPVSRDISPSDSFRAPDHFAEEWYVSIDGDQFGPYSLPKAKEWVATREAGDELYCWKEDFDDWLLVDKVSHFRGLRAPSATPAPRAPSRPAAPAAGGRLAAGPVAEPEPKPLFTATMDRIEAQHGASTDDPGGGNGQPATGKLTAQAVQDMLPDHDDLDLEIGEASRVVKLEHIRPRGPSQEDDSDPGALPGVARIPASGRLGAGTGTQRALVPLSEGSLAGAQPPILSTPAEPRRSPLIIPLLIGAIVVAGAVAVLLYVYSTGDDEAHGGRLARPSVGGDELARRHDTPVFGRATDDGEPVIEDDDDDSGKTITKRKTGTGSKTGNTVGFDDGPSVPTVPGDESGIRPLRPSDVIIMSRKQALGNRRCYERALKKDPFLDVKKIAVKLVVAPSGVVTEVTLDSYASSFLGQCLAQRIRAWPFRKSTQGIAMNLTLSFEQTN